MKEVKESARIYAMVDNRDGTVDVLRCSDKERPQGHRSIVRRWTFPSKPKALTFIEAAATKKVQHVQP